MLTRKSSDIWNFLLRMQYSFQNQENVPLWNGPVHSVELFYEISGALFKRLKKRTLLKSITSHKGVCRVQAKLTYVGFFHFTVHLHSFVKSIIMKFWHYELKESWPLWNCFRGRCRKNKSKKKLTSFSFMYVCVAENGEMLVFFLVFFPQQ